MPSAQPSLPLPSCQVETKPKWIRLRGLVLLAAGAGTIALGLAMRPAEDGLGTHKQLGLPACSFLAATGWPCITCGLTSSYAFCLHGRFVEAWKSQPFGFWLALASIAMAGVGAAELAAGRSLLWHLRPKWWLLAAVIGLPAGWVFRLITGWLDGSLPVR
jgi:hypothetical protein